MVSAMMSMPDGDLGINLGVICLTVILMSFPGANTMSSCHSRLAALTYPVICKQITPYSVSLC